MKILSIGCGKSFGGDIIGLDRGDYGQDYVRDMRRGLPFDSDSLDKIIADSCLEHLPQTEHFQEDDFVFVINECLRCLKVGGTLEITVPKWSSEMAHKDPTHYRYFAEKTFGYIEDVQWEYGFNKGLKVKDIKLDGENIIAIMEKI